MVFIIISLFFFFVNKLVNIFSLMTCFVVDQPSYIKCVFYTLHICRKTNNSFMNYQNLINYHIITKKKINLFEQLLYELLRTYQPIVQIMQRSNKTSIFKFCFQFLFWTLFIREGQIFFFSLDHIFSLTNDVKYNIKYQK